MISFFKQKAGNLKKTRLDKTGQAYSTLKASVKVTSSCLQHCKDQKATHNR